MREPFGPEWMRSNALAFDAYERGDWEVAGELFQNVLAIKPDDKPTQNLLNFMQQHGNIPPTDWKGFKFFDE
jgi:hypothetical protein